jgi:hypothetical protein
MESLALLAAVIMLVIILLGVISLIAVFRRPKSSISRGLFTVMHVASIFAGGWLMALPVGIGARIIGFAVCAAGCVGLLRIFRRSSPS